MEESKEETKVEDLIASWEDHAGVKEEQVEAPKCGCLFKQDDNSIIAFVGTGPDACVNDWSYKLTQLKHTQNTEEVCTPYSGTKFDALSWKDGGAPPIDLIVLQGHHPYPHGQE
eukprot:9428247-Ditylum_brightwellii.AAC.1